MKARYPGSISKGFDSSVVKISTTIKDYLLNALFKGAFGNKFANSSRSVTAAGMSFNRCS